MDQSPLRSEDMMLDEQMLSLLPDDGAPVLNRMVRLSLSRTVERRVTQQEYFKIRDQLIADGKIGRARGPGGQVYLIQDPDDPPHPLISQTLPITEADLMPFLENYLETAFQTGLDLPSGSHFILEDTSQRGPRRGQWARPDFILVTLLRYRFQPQKQLDLHAFELKTENGCNVQAVHEALAQTRFTHYGHLVWHLPENSPHTVRLEDIRAQCISHGVGLILMREPGDPESYEILVDARRKNTPLAIVDGFLEARLTDENQKRLARLLGV
ncbi:MAG: hypothetical protein KTR21_02760 [Rhodobacteraceae bacterium]|nr:hypothetical protein [Paracoccaceae bacterium]